MGKGVKQPWWKYLLSHVHEFSIETVGSNYSDFLELGYHRGRYVLNSTDAIYSYEDLYTNYRESFRRINWERFALKDVLILGLGLGSIPQLLEQQFGQHAQYTAVEIDEEVIYLAEKYTLPKLSSSITTVCADAAQFVAQCESQFDMIAVDVFIHDEVPKAFENIDFLENIKRLLRPSSILLYNRLTSYARAQENTRRFYNEEFSHVFPKSSYLDLHDNWMLLNQPLP